jgi:hypothetical protein
LQVLAPERIVDRVFAHSSKIAACIEGMLSEFSIAAMDSLLAFQTERGIKGDMVELGVFRGKSAAVLAGRLSPDETLHLYDIADYFDRPALAQTGARLSYNVGSTLALSKRRFSKHSIRFCHVDASHMFDPTIHEIALADFMLAPDGILCLDDYTNLNYSQILAATFKYLFTKRTDLTIFLVTNEKAYLCRRRQFPVYADFVLHSMLAQMRDRHPDDLCIARTDDTRSYGAFYLRPRSADETGDLYGTEIYAPFYEIKDHSRLKAIARRAACRIKGPFRRHG